MQALAAWVYLNPNPTPTPNPNPDPWTMLAQPNGTALRYGLVGFYRAGDEAALKDRLKFPYPFAGWSLGREGSGFWCSLRVRVRVRVRVRARDSGARASHS